MKTNILNTILIICGFLAYHNLNAEEITKRTMSFDQDWYFRIENTDEAINSPTHWAKVDIPHDWSVEMPFSRIADGGIATGHKAGGIAWYKKTFTLDNEDFNKLITLCFDGVYMESEIWLNGKKVFYHPNGYTPFRCDITAFCNPPQVDNELMVKVVNVKKK